SGRTTAQAEAALDAGGRIVMPGLIDAHFHAYAVTAQIRQLEWTPPSLLAHQARPLLEAALRRGFTTVRDAAGADAGLAAAVESGLIDGPRIFFGGRALTMTGGHGDTRGAYEPCGCDSSVLSQVVDGVDNVRRVVRDELRKGAHQIKIFVSGGVASPTDPIWSDQYSDEEIRAIVEEASARRSYVLAHAYTARSIARAVACGVRCIEHANLIDADTAKRVAKAGAYVVPTLVTYEALAEFGAVALPPSGIEKLNVVRSEGLRAIEHCRKAGVKLGFGTDLLGPMHAWESREFGLRAQVEKPVDVLRSATSINAEILQQTGRLGTIAAGAKADVLVVDGNPLDNISVMQRPEQTLRAIVKDGRIVKNDL
ncbi:MAG: amidohydrolase family protein, partial [Candidatus Eremiobacteraeota bacterium]|nr:amidohydrolase family protein [Candidatus Eremiobacteraeota bacterium]